jgi:hypothetical protein
MMWDACRYDTETGVFCQSLSDDGRLGIQTVIAELEL